MNTKNWQRAAHDAERERDNALAQLAHEQANRREWQAQYQAEHRDYLNEVEADRDRLRDGIKAMITDAAHSAAALRNAKDLPAQHRAAVYAATASMLRALLDGEAKG